MKTIFYLLFLLPMMIFGQSHGIEINASIPGDSIKMKDVYFKTYSLRDIKSDNGLLVIFTSNTCPFVKAWEKSYSGIYTLAENNGIGMALINSNEAFRETTESVSEMKKVMESYEYSMIPYLADKDSELADLFDANTTPHVFLFNSDGILVYRGSIDDMFENKDRSITKNYLFDALIAVGNGQTPKVQTTKNIGCSIKRVKMNSEKKSYQVIE
ncbi:MAG: redoxin domain-containing protein [Bacteroidota bacterium]